jgi:putative endonuclease
MSRLIAWLRTLFQRESSLSKDSVGRWGEEEAARFLRQCGYRILERNWRVNIGEIDIVASKGGQVAFVEVKASVKLAAISPEMRVGAQKQRKLRALAQAYLQGKKEEPDSIRFDVISVWREGNETKIEHFENAF